MATIALVGQALALTGETLPSSPLSRGINGTVTVNQALPSIGTVLTSLHGTNTIGSLPIAEDIIDIAVTVILMVTKGSSLTRLPEVGNPE